MKKYYIAAFVPENTDGFSVYFPDIPGCVTAGQSLEECVEYGENALKIMLRDLAERHTPIPAPSSLENVKTKVRAMRAENDLPTPETAFYQLFAAPSVEMTPVKVTISMPRAVLEEVDAKAKAAGLTRSGFLAHAAQVYQSRRH